MRWFRRRRPEDELPDPRTAWPEQAVPDDPVAAAERFWRRWAEMLPEISAALGDREPQRVEGELAAAVAELHPHLHVSLERGQRAIYALVVSGQEDPALRPFTDAWKAAAPPEDAIWEYHDSVPPVPDPTGVTVNLGTRSVALADVRVAAQVDEAEGVVDVAVHHPLLGELDAAARSAMTFLPLDATLGERLAAERLRRVETAETEPAGAITLLELRDLVRGLDEEHPETVGGAD
ncbi:hypothetical protein [Amycolatopsis sp. 3B14]|uniref:hypothetical protein n=1 Tax=Amycolatopsis sp. 3B14 TaxID=3243600 RepID=UPI003D95467B